MPVSPLDELTDSPGAPGELLRQEPYDTPLVTENPVQTKTRINRIRAADLKDRGIPTFINASGGVSPVTDEIGTALSAFNPRTGIAYDSKGQPKSVDFGEEGPPTISNPFDRLPATIDKKTGAVEKYGPGGIYQYLGQDPETTQKVAREAQDKSISKISTLMGRKLSLDEHDLVQGMKQHKQLHNDLTTAVPGLLDPKFQGADEETVKKAIDDHFNTLYGSPEANQTAGFFSRDLSPAAVALRADIDQKKADAYEKAQQIFQLNDKLSTLHGDIETGRMIRRAQTETLLAHQLGMEGPLDQHEDETPKIGPAGQPTPSPEDRQKILTADDAVDQVHDQIRAGNIPPVAAPAVVAATHDIQDAQKKSEELKKSDPTLADKFKNVAANLLNGLNQGVGDLIKAMSSDSPFPGGTADPLNWLPKGVSDLERKAFGKSFGDVLQAGAVKVSSESAAMVDDRLKNTLAAKSANIIGGLVPYVATAIATKGTSVATPLMATMFYSTGYQRTLEDAKAHGASPVAAEGAATTVGAINAVLALPLKTVGAAAEAIFGDTAPKVIQRSIENAYENGGPAAVGNLLGKLAEYIRVGGKGAEGVRQEAVDAINNIKAEMAKTPAQRMATVVATTAKNAALGAGVQTAENLVKKTYNPDQGTFEGVGEQALVFGGLGAVSEGFRQVANARKAKQALDIINSKGGGAEPPTVGGGKGPTPAAPSGAPQLTEGGEKVGDTQGRISPTEKGGPTAGPSAGEPARSEGAGAQPQPSDAKTGSGKGKAPQVLTSISEAEQAYVEQGGHADKLEGQQKLAALREQFPNKSDRIAAINEHLSSFSPSDEGVKTDISGKGLVDAAAHEAATSPKNGLPEPSGAQKEAGNYQMGHVDVGGLDISIENPAGSKRKAHFEPLQSHYGYIKGTVGADKDHVDIFVKQGTPKDWSGPVFVVNQYNQDGKFDEHKAVIGVNSEAEAKSEYLGNYQKGWTGGKSVVRFENPAAFKKWAEGTKKGIPAQDMRLPANLRRVAMLSHVTYHGTGESGHLMFSDTSGERPTTFSIPKPEASLLGEKISKIRRTGGFAPEVAKVGKLVQGAMSARRDSLKAVGHSITVTPITGDEKSQIGIGTSSEGEILVDHEKLAKATAEFSDREKSRTIQRAIDEEIIHVAAIKWEKQSPENAAKIKAWGAEDDELGKFLAQAYSGWDGMSDRAKGHEKIRAVIQKRWTGRLTETARAIMRELVKFFREIYDKLTDAQRKIVDSVESILKGEPTKERGPPAEGVKKRAEMLVDHLRTATDKRVRMEKYVIATFGRDALLEAHAQGLVERPNATSFVWDLSGKGKKAELAPTKKGVQFPPWEKILETYSADKIPEGKVRKPVEINGKLWITGGGVMGRETTELIELVPADQFAGKKTTYGEKTRYQGPGDKYAGDSARNDPQGFYYGMQVQYGGKKYVLGGKISITKELVEKQSVEGVQNAIDARKEQSGKGGELSRVPPRKDVRANAPEIRKGEGAKTDAGSGAIERPPASATEQKPKPGQLAVSSKLDKATQDEMKSAFEGLFAALPTKHLSGKDKTAVVLLKKGKSVDQVARMLVMKPEQVEQAYDKSIGQVPILGAAKPPDFADYLLATRGAVQHAPKQRKEQRPKLPITSGKAHQMLSGAILTKDDSTAAWVDQAFKMAQISGDPSQVGELGKRLDRVMTPVTMSQDRQLRLFAGKPKSGRQFELPGTEEAFNLTGEEGVDWEARQKAAEQVAIEQAAAQKKQDEQQSTLFSGKPTGVMAQRALPPDKLGQFVQLAQKLIAGGIDTPEKLATEIDAMDQRARPFSQALWDAMGMINPELRGTHDWSQIYGISEPEPKLTAPSPAQVTSYLETRSPTGETYEDTIRTGLAKGSKKKLEQVTQEQVWNQAVENLKRDLPTVRKPAAPRPDGGFSEHPLIRAIQGNVGGILSKSAAKARWSKEKFDQNSDLWDGAPRLADPRHMKIYDPKGGQAPDQTAQILFDEGLLKDSYVDTMWQEIQKVSDSSKRIERQEAAQSKQEAEWTKRQEEEERASTGGGFTSAPLRLMAEHFEEEDPFALQDDIRAKVLKEVLDGYTDLAEAEDSLKGIPKDQVRFTPLGFEIDNEALREAINVAKLARDDRGSGIGVEPTGAEPEPTKQGGSSGVQIGSGTTDRVGQVSDDLFGGSKDIAESGPLSGDIPSAPHREGSDQPVREPASDLPERAAGSELGTGGRRASDLGVSPDTGRTKIAGENLGVAGNTGSLAGISRSGAELDEIARISPALQSEQVEDVRFIEARLRDQGKAGVMITNGTGTGKTFTGLGAINQALNRGAKDVLVVVPSDKIGADWVATGKEFFDIADIIQLPSTTSNGKGHRVVVTTYANFGQNDELVKRPWAMVVADESHYLSSAEGGESTLALDALRALTWHPQGITRRVAMLEPAAHDRVRALRALEIHRIRAKGKLTQAESDERDRHIAILDARRKEVTEQQSSKTIADRPKSIFMSATPFAYRKSVDYANGYLFDYPVVQDRGYNTPSPYGQFMIENFGYRMRYGKLTEPENAIATGILERRFAERLMREGAMRGRALVVPFDYSRDFILTQSQLGAKIDEILKVMMDDPRLRVLEGKIGVSDYLQRRFILEALKAREAIPRIRKHIALGRKILVHHDYKLGGSSNPLSANFLPGEAKQVTIDGRKETIYLTEAYASLKNRFPDWEEVSAQLSGLESPITAFTKAFGGEEGLLGIFNGSVPKKQRRKLTVLFNAKGGKMKILLAQRASSKEGISLHDTHGISGEQRARVDLGIPARPTDATQCEGRNYRIGLKSNAIQEYLNTGTNWERWTFAQTIAQRASTAENLAMGEGARALLNAFSQGFLDASEMDPHEGQGTGGKANDEVRERGDPFKNAVALFYTNEKKTSRSKSREGIDYFATPEPLGYKMVQWTMVQPGEKFLEPSAGHGAIARFAPDAVTRHAVEPSNELASRLALNAPDTEVHNQRFEDFNIVNKFDAIASNSPWGVGGKTAMEHLEKEVKHLKDAGRVVALLPMGPSMEGWFEKWWNSEDRTPNLHIRARVLLPGVTFARAGTTAMGEVVVIDRSDDKDFSPGEVQLRDLRDAKSLEDLFNRLEHLSVIGRPDKKTVEPEAGEAEEPEGTGAGRAPGTPEKQLLSPDQQLPAASKDSSFTPSEFKHTKTGAPIFVARTARYFSKTEFAAARDRAKEFGGYYSSYKKEGAIPGFHFKTAEARDAFIGVNGQTPDVGQQGYEDAGLGEGETLGAAKPLKVAAGIYKEDVERIAKEIGLTVKESLTMLRHLVAPTSGVNAEALTRAMKMLGDRNQKAYETDRVLEAARKSVDKWDRSQQIEFVDRIKRGEPQPTPELQDLANTLRKIDTESWSAAVAAYNALGFKGANVPLAWKENHFRVLWKVIPGSGEEKGDWIGRARRGLRGSMGQHKQATLDDMSEGIEQGGVPYTYNFIVMSKLANADLWKLTSTLRAWKWAKDNGFVEYVKGPFPKAPDGMVPLDDSIAKVYFPAQSGEGLVAAGQYFVEEGFGRLLNNYLATDHIRAVKIGRGLLWIKNATTMVELSLSPFHAIFETLDAVGSNIGLGLQKLVNRGVLGGSAKVALEGLLDMVKALGTPVTHGLGAKSLGAQIRRAAANPAEFFKTAEGKQMLKSFPLAPQMINDLFEGGWKPTELEQDWRNKSVRTFVDAIGDIKAGTSDNYIGAGLRAFPAANEMLMRPLFDYYIPNLKVAQFFKEYAERLKQADVRFPNGYYIDRQGKRWNRPTNAEMARQTWRFVEDRFGEMNYDNLFWNRTFKSAMQLMFRSVTWKLGSVSAFAGAFHGQGKEFVDAFKEGRAPELHRNMAWLFGMCLLTAALGTITMKALTGKWPSDLTDLVFPQIDPKDPKIRASHPTYFKDLVHLIHSPITYITASLSGWIGRVADLWRNRDYYGVQIHDNDDPVVKQAIDIGEYMGQTLLPFSIRGYKNLSAQDVGGLRKSLALVGINPAPRFIGQTAAERQESEYWKDQGTEAGVKPGVMERRLEKRSIVTQIAHGESPNISKAITAGAIKPKEVKSLYQRAGMGSLAFGVLHMPLDEAEKVYQRANLKERASLEAIMARKRASAATRNRPAFSGF